MSEKQEKKRRYNQRLEYIADLGRCYCVGGNAEIRGGSQMTVREAIKVLRWALNRLEGHNYIIDDYGTADQSAKVNAFGMAIEALEKQTPEKPCKDNENGVYEKEHCPSCHRSLFPNDHHCECGQAIDWSVRE